MFGSTIKPDKSISNNHNTKDNSRFITFTSMGSERLFFSEKNKNDAKLKFFSVIKLKKSQDCVILQKFSPKRQ